MRSKKPFQILVKSSIYALLIARMYFFLFCLLECIHTILINCSDSSTNAFFFAQVRNRGRISFVVDIEREERVERGKSQPIGVNGKDWSRNVF